MADSSVTLWDRMKDQLTTLVIATVVGIAALFAGTVTEAIKTGINVADRRTASFDSLAKAVGECQFQAERCIEAMKLGTIDEPSGRAAMSGFDAAVATLCKNRRLDNALLEKTWGTGTAIKHALLITSVKKLNVILTTISVNAPSAGPSDAVTVEKRQGVAEQLSSARKAAETAFAEFEEKGNDLFKVITPK